MDLLGFIALFATALLAGAVNSVAGGGTFLTFPMMIFYGLTPVQANITSTIALWPGTMASVVAYRREWMAQKHELPALLAISVIGGGVGAWILLATPEHVFAWMVPWLLLGATLLFTFGRRLIAWVHRIFPERENSHWRQIAARVFQCVIALYGGYFGAGIGILMLAMLQVMGVSNIHRMNGLKTVLGAAINAIAVVIFITAGAVVWPVAVVMILGAVIGGYWGAALAQKLPPEPVRWLVSAIGFAMTAYFFVYK